jgi:hypothetical protein
VNNAALERLSSITERVQARPAAAALEQAPAKKEAYRWKEAAAGSLFFGVVAPWLRCRWLRAASTWLVVGGKPASRARPVNNAALERLSSITERVQARPAAAALEPDEPGRAR